MRKIILLILSMVVVANYALAVTQEKVSTFIGEVKALSAANEKLAKGTRNPVIGSQDLRSANDKIAAIKKLVALIMVEIKANNDAGIEETGKKIQEQLSALIQEYAKMLQKAAFISDKHTLMSPSRRVKGSPDYYKPYYSETYKDTFDSLWAMMEQAANARGTMGGAKSTGYSRSGYNEYSKWQIRTSDK